MPLFRFLNKLSYQIVHSVLSVFAQSCITLLRKTPKQADILHISEAVNICRETVELLKSKNLRVQYLAQTKVKKTGIDYAYAPSKLGAVRAFQEWLVLLTYLRHFQIVHTHFGLGISRSGWEFPVLKQLDVRIVWHHRGCSSRIREENNRLHHDPVFNICQNCDYDGRACSEDSIVQRRNILTGLADAHIVTTPDLRDFFPQASHITFFSPTNHRTQTLNVDPPKYQKGDVLKLVQITNHPGIEGAQEVQVVIKRLQDQGYRIDYQLHSSLEHKKAIEVMSNAHVTIGKMKMGHYANNQIESLALGVPAITFIRPEWVTQDYIDSAFILTDLHNLEKTVLNILEDPLFLRTKAELCQETIQRFHNNENLIDQYVQLYNKVRTTKT